MAAVLTTAPAPRLPGAPAPRRPARPRLTVLPGGRSAQAMAPVYRRRRIVAALLLVTLLVVGWLAVDAALGAARGLAAPQPARIEGPTVVVEADPGDTLWTVARRVRPSGDVRPAVEAMLAERGTADLQVGDEVRVPVG